MLRRLHDANEEFVNYPYSVGILGWTFMEAENIISTIANTTLNGAVSSGATSFTLTSGTDFDDPGGTGIAAFYIINADDIIDYGTYLDRSGTSITSVAGIQMAHLTAEEIHKVYQLPTDFGKIRQVFLENDVEYFYFDDNKRQLPPERHFMLKYFTNSTYSRSFIVFKEDIGAQTFKIYYLKKATTIDEITDTIDAPDGAGRRFIIERMKEYVWNVLGEENDAVIASQRATRAIRECADKWTSAQVTPSQSINLRW